MKIFNNILKVLLGLLLISPILGVLGVFPKPTPDLYNTPEGFAFIDMLYNGRYVMWIMAVVFALCLFLIITNRMALASLLLLPITVNIIGFHAFMDGGLFTPGAVMANLLLLINLYFIWRNWGQIKLLWNKGNN